MITANQWYNIAQTAQVGTKSGIRIDFGTKYALFKVSVDYGNAVIAAVESNITAEETRLSVRIRYNNSAWFVDVRFSVSQETTLSAATYDNTGWEAVSPNTSVAGNTICIINDLTSLIRPSGGGESLFELMNVGTAEVPRFAVVPKKYNGVEVGIISNTFISMAGFEEPDDDTPVASSSLGDLLDVQITDPKSKDVLTYDEDLRKWVNGPGGLDETALGNYLTTNKYITQDALSGALNGYVTNEIYNTAITALNLRLTELETAFKEWFYYDDVNKAIRTKLSLIVDGTLSMGELGSGGGTEAASGKLADLLDVQITDPASGQILLYNEEKGLWVNGSAGLNEEQLEAYLKGKDYATNSALSSLQTSVNTLRTDFDNLNTLLNGNVGGIIDTWNEVVSFLDGYSQSDDLASILSGMNSDIANRVLIEDFEELEGSVTDISNRVKTFEDVIGIDSNGDVYIKGTRNFYTAGGTISMFGLSEGDSGEVASVSIKFEGSDVLYNPINGVITLPAYPSGGGVADSVAWSNVTNKPTTLAGYGITDALSVNGGFISSSGWRTQLNILRTEVGDSVIGFFNQNTNNYLGAIGFDNDTNLIVNIKNVGNANVLHSGNYSSYALPLSGGIVGDLVINATSDAFLQILLNGTSKALVGWQSNHGVRLYNYASASYLSIKDDGTPNYNGNTLYHTGNFNPADYLPKSGGTITGSLTIKNDSWTPIIFERGGYTSWIGTSGVIIDVGHTDGYLSVGKDTLQFVDYNTARDILHSGNYFDYAYPKDGRGYLSFDANGRPVMINNQGYSAKNTSGDIEEVMWLNLNNIVYLGGTSSQKVCLYDYNPSCLSGALIHSGNIGSYKSGSADYISNSTYYYDGNVLTNDVSAYSLFGSIPADNRMFPAFMDNHPTWSGWADVAHFTGYCMYGATQFATEYNAINPRVAIRKYNQTRNDWGDWTEFITTANIGSQSVNYANSAARLSSVLNADCNVASGDGVKIISNLSGIAGNFPNGYTSGLSVMSSYVGWQLVSYGGDIENPYFRSYQDNGTWKPWRQLAFLTDNVASATKLQTGRYLWNNYYNGESDVNGRPWFKVSSADASINVDIASIIAGPVNSSRQGYSSGLGFNGLLGYGGYDNHLHGWIGLNGWYSGAGAETYALVFAVNDNTTYGSVPTERMRITPNGNVLIGTTTDAGSKLQVYGSAILNNSYFGSSGVWGPPLGAMRDGTIGLAIYESTYGLWAWTNATSGDSYLQVARNDNLTNVYNLLLQPYGGNILIGTESDNGNKLQVNGSITATEWLYGGDNCGMYITNAGVYYSNHTYYANIESAGNEICIGGNTGGSIYVNYRVPRHYNIAPTSWVWCAGSSDSRADHYIGNLVATGTVAMGTLSSSSDARLKDNIKLLTDDESLAVLRQLRPSKWNWKSNGALSYGFIAQEVESVASCMVDRMNDEELGQKLYLQYNQLHAFEVGAIQHIDSEVEQLKRGLKTANLKIEKLENELKQYRLCQ